MAMLYLNGKGAEFGSEPNQPLPMKHDIDLENYDQNKWYPYQVVRSTDYYGQLTFNDYLEPLVITAPFGLNNLNCSYAHGGRVTASLTAIASDCSWGARNGSFGYLLDDTQQNVLDNTKIIALKTSFNNNGFIFYLRGGLHYILYTNLDRSGKLYSDGFTSNQESFPVLDKAPTNSSELIDLRSKLGG